MTPSIDIALIVVGSCVALVSLYSFLFSAVLDRLGVHGAPRFFASIAFAGVIGGNFAYALIRSLNSQTPISIGFLILLLWPPIAALVLLTVGAVGRMLRESPPSALVAVQATRVFGAVFLLAMARNQLPPSFALPAGLGDVLVGLAAMPIACALQHDGVRAAPYGLVWNAFGVFDLFVALGTGIGLFAGIDRSIFGPDPIPSGLFLPHFPLVLIPTFAVPLLLSFHVFSTAQLTFLVRTRTRGGQKGHSTGYESSPANA